MLKKIVLIGPPGAGKTSIGKALSKELAMTFIDSDSEVEKIAGKKIAEIFVDNGEPAFRKMEVEVVSKLLATSSGVIALGGGAPINEQIQKELANADFPVIFIDVSISQAANRVGFNKDRPLLLINPRQQWINLMSTRRPIYERLSSEIISSDNRKPAEVAAIICEKVKSKL